MHSQINHLLILHECQEDIDKIEIRKTANEFIFMKVELIPCSLVGEMWSRTKTILFSRTIIAII